MTARPGSMVLLATALGAARLVAGPYSQALNDPANVHDAPVPGFVGPHGIGKAAFSYLDINSNLVTLNPQNVVNPLFFGWAGEVADYSAAGTVTVTFADPQYALGPVTGDHFLGVVALGDLTASGISAGDPPGSITLVLERPARNLSGADFVVFENGVVAGSNNGGAGAGHLFAELAYVEVSADGENFVRFPSVSLNGPLTPLPGFGTTYASLDVSNVRNLAGKHANGYGESWGTPFDLTDVGLQEITHIRLVDIPGTGDFADSQDPPNPIYDPWETWGSGGFDLEAVGVISAAMTFGGWPQLATLPAGQRGPGDDPDGDGCANLLEYAFATQPGRADAFVPGISLVAGKPAITLRRDERLTDVIYEVQAAPDLAGTWVTIARSEGGGAFVAVNGHSPEIADEAAETIKSIGVLRRVTVRDTAAAGPRRFLRVKASLQPAFLPGT